jgi:hypothetical protein
MVATPDLTFTVTPPGGSAIDYTQYLSWGGADQSITINQNFGRQGDTAVFPLVDEYVTTPHFHIDVLSQVKLVDNNLGVTLFAGVCNDPVQNATSPNRNEWYLQCTDYTYYADNAIVYGNFYGLTTQSIIISLTNLANCGISAKKVVDGGYIHNGPTLASYVQNYATLSDAWRKLAQLAGQVTPYGWYVDETRHLHFYDATSASSSGVTFTTTPTTAGGSNTQGHFYVGTNFGYEWDGTSVKNRILVQGANQTISYGSTSHTPTNTWRADGTQRSWPLRYTPTGSPVLKINSKNTTVNLVTASEVGTVSGSWLIEQNNSGQWFLNASSTPGTGTIIKIWYDYQIPIVAQASDHPSQTLYTGPNNGIFAEYINDTTLTTVPMALARAQRERQEYAFAAERITFTTTEAFLGWLRAGQTCKIVNQFIWDTQDSSWGINDTFLVTGNTITFGQGGYRQMQITAVRV